MRQVYPGFYSTNSGIVTSKKKPLYKIILSEIGLQDLENREGRKERKEERDGRSREGRGEERRRKRK